MSAEQDEPEATQERKGPVGYCSPPLTTRFKKGASGNPKGRPKGSLNVVTVLMKTLREKVIINENGRRTTVTKLEAALKQLVNKAAAGDLRALRQLIELARDAEARQNLDETQAEALNDFDREVMRGILQRFQVSEEEKPSSGEEDHDEAEPR